ncbi:MAG: amidase family protein, partial [Gaiellales bacterium]
MTATLADIRSRLDSGSVTSEALVESVLDAGHGAGAVERPIARSRSLARASDARRRAGRSRGPLDGVPFGVKVNFDVQGEPTTSGLMPAGPPAASDARSVALLVAEGAIPAIGTTMAPAALGTVTPHPDIGLCQNPRDASRGAGGSSGGSAAAVGSGLVPFALGSDTLGSVRIPAAHCGVVGWIPTHGSVSTRGLVPLAPPLDSVGLLCAAAHDLQWLVAPLFAPDPRHPWWRARPGFVPPHRPRIADCVLGERADERGRQATEALIDEFVAIGAVRTTTVALTVEPRVVRRRALLLAEICAAVTFREAREAGHLPNHADTLVDYGARASGTR